MTYIPEGAKWYLAWIVMEITVEGDLRNVVHTNLHLIRANSPDVAYEKAIALGKESELSYDNPQGRTMTIRFRGLHELHVIYEELRHGAELAYDEKIGVPEEDIQQLLAARDQLAVFHTAYDANSPNYASKEVLEPLAKPSDRFGDLQDAI